MNKRSRVTAEPPLINVADAESRTGVSEWTWRRLAYTGEIESVKVRNRLMVPLVEVRRVIAEGTRHRRDGLPAGCPKGKLTEAEQPNELSVR